jgi:hypothetical protein
MRGQIRQKRSYECVNGVKFGGIMKKCNPIPTVDDDEDQKLVCFMTTLMVKVGDKRVLPTKI